MPRGMLLARRRRVSRHVWRKVCTFEGMLAEKQRMEESMEESCKAWCSNGYFQI